MKTVRLEAVPTAFGAADAVQIALCLAILLAAIRHARRAARGVARTSLIVRVAMPALAIAASFTLLSLVQGMGPGTDMVVPALLMLLLMLLVSLLLILAIEAVAWRFGPIRTAAWMGSAFLLFLGSFLVVPFALLAWLAPSMAGPLLNWQMLELVAIIAAGALVWWSCLPPVEPSLRGVFD